MSPAEGTSEGLCPFLQAGHDSVAPALPLCLLFLRWCVQDEQGNDDATCMVHAALTVHERARQAAGVRPRTERSSALKNPLMKLIMCLQTCAPPKVVNTN